MHTLYTLVLVFTLFTNNTNVIKQSARPQQETKKVQVIESPETITKSHKQAESPVENVNHWSSDETESPDETEYLCLETSDGVTECHVIWHMPDGSIEFTEDDAPPVGWFETEN